MAGKVPTFEVRCALCYVKLILMTSLICEIECMHFISTELLWIFLGLLENPYLILWKLNFSPIILKLKTKTFFHHGSIHVCQKVNINVYIMSFICTTQSLYNYLTYGVGTNNHFMCSNTLTSKLTVQK